MRRWKPGEIVWWVTGLAEVRQMQVISQHGRWMVLRYVPRPVPWLNDTTDSAHAADVFATWEDAENYARVLREWDADDLGLGAEGGAQ